MVDGGVDVDDWGIAQDAAVARIGSSDALVLRLRTPGTTRHLLVVCERRQLAVGLVDAAAKDVARAAIRAGEPSSDAQALRAALEGARVVGVVADGIVVDGPEGRRIVFAVAASKMGIRPAPDASPSLPDEHEARVRGGELAARLAEVALDGARDRIAKLIAKAIDRLERRVVAISEGISIASPLRRAPFAPCVRVCSSRKVRRRLAEHARSR